MEDAKIERDLSVKVGGIGGIGASEAKCKISLARFGFTSGEEAKICVDMDNSACSKPIKSYKFKLKRKVECFSNVAKMVGSVASASSMPSATFEEYLLDVREAGCDAKQKEKKTCGFKLPPNDANIGKIDNLHPDLRQLVKIFTQSITTELFSVQYSIDVFVKHQSKLEFGMGNFVTFPLNIVSGPIAMPRADQKYSDWV